MSKDIMVICGIDFGGTNLRLGEVNPKTGKLLKKSFSVPMNTIKTNDELTQIILSQIGCAKKIGISAAGDVDERNLIIKMSPNSRIKEHITFGKTLKQKGFDVIMTNDMKAAVQGVARFGEGKKYQNVLVATYSSGFNCAVARDKINTTAAELSHIIYKQNGDLFCSCGGMGHLDTYVSGNGAASMAKQYFFITKQSNHTILDLSLEEYNKKKNTKYTPKDLKKSEVFALIVSSITSKHVYLAYSSNPNQEPQKHIRNIQIEAIANSFGTMVSAFNPLDLMVLMGSQTNDWDILFKPAIKKYNSSTTQYQLASLEKPKIIKTNLSDIGIIGAAAYFIVTKTCKLSNK